MTHQPPEKDQRQNTELRGALNALSLPEDEIEYPDTAEWQSLGATVRQEAKARREQRNRVLRFRFFAAAAALAVLLGVMHLLSSRGPDTAPHPQVADRPAPAAADTSTAQAENHDTPLNWESEVLLLELDYASLALTRVAGVDPGNTAKFAAIFENHDIDPVDIYLEAKRAL